MYRKQKQTPFNVYSSHDACFHSQARKMRRRTCTSVNTSSLDVKKEATKATAAVATFNNFTYNKTRKLISKITGETEKDTDLFSIAQLFYVVNGQLARAGSLMLADRLKSIGNNGYQGINYYNVDPIGYSFSTFKLNTAKSSLKIVR